MSHMHYSTRSTRLSQPPPYLSAPVAPAYNAHIAQHIHRAMGDIADSSAMSPMYPQHYDQHVQINGHAHGHAAYAPQPAYSNSPGGYAMPIGQSHNHIQHNHNGVHANGYSSVEPQSAHDYSAGSLPAMSDYSMTSSHSGSAMQSPDINSQISMQQPTTHIHHHNFSTDYSTGMLPPQHSDDNLTGEFTSASTYQPHTSKYGLPDGFEHFNSDKPLTESLLSSGEKSLGSGSGGRRRRATRNSSKLVSPSRIQKLDTHLQLVQDNVNSAGFDDNVVHHAVVMPAKYEPQIQSNHVISPYTHQASTRSHTKLPAIGDGDHHIRRTESGKTIPEHALRHMSGQQLQPEPSSPTSPTPFIKHAPARGKTAAPHILAQLQQAAAANPTARQFPVSSSSTSSSYPRGSPYIASPPPASTDVSAYDETDESSPYSDRANRRASTSRSRKSSSRKKSLDSRLHAASTPSAATDLLSPSTASHASNGSSSKGKGRKRKQAVTPATAPQLSSDSAQSSTATPSNTSKARRRLTATPSASSSSNVIKQCEYCSTPHNGSYGGGRFCGPKCARTYSIETRHKKRKST